MSSRDIRTYGVRQIDDYVPEDRPNQEDLWFDEDGDRLLWQLQLNRRETAETRETRVRATHPRRVQGLQELVVHISSLPVSDMPRHRETQDTQPSQATEGGDKRDCSTDRH